jgi:hypothetical protein
VYGAQAEGCSSGPGAGVRRAFVQHAEFEAPRRSEREGDGISVLPSPHAVGPACATTVNSPTVHLAFMTACFLSNILHNTHNNASLNSHGSSSPALSTARGWTGPDWAPHVVHVDGAWGPDYGTHLDLGPSQEDFITLRSHWLHV